MKKPEITSHWIMSYPLQRKTWIEFRIKKTIPPVTMSYTGKLIWAGEHELVLESPAWVADSGRFMQALRVGSLDEVEPMNEKAIIGRGAIVDASIIDWELPTEQK